MHKSSTARDQRATEAATSEYLADWLKLILTLISQIQVRYGISYRELSQWVTVLVSVSHQMEAHSQSPLFQQGSVSRLIHAMETNSSLECETCWIQLTIDGYLAMNHETVRYDGDWPPTLSYTGDRPDRDEPPDSSLAPPTGPNEA